MSRHVFARTPDYLTLHRAPGRWSGRLVERKIHKSLPRACESLSSRTATLHSVPCVVRGAWRVTRAHVLWCTCGAHVCRVGPVLWCFCCVPFFRVRDAVCVAMSSHVFARTPSLRDSDTHLPVRCTISSRSGAIGSRAP